MADSVRGKEFLKSIEQYKQKIVCEKCGVTEREVRLGSLRVNYGEKAKKSLETMDFALVICGQCKRMLVFQVPLRENVCVEVSEGAKSERVSKKKQCVVCGGEGFRTLYSRFPCVARGHVPGAYEICVCEKCGAAYFFEERINFGTWGGVRMIAELHKLAASFKCENCGQQEAVASRTSFGKTILGLFWKGDSVISVCCKNCKYVQLYWDWDLIK